MTELSKPQKTRVAAYGIIKNRSKVLLCRLSEQVPHWQGYWTLPGGGLDFGEDPQRAMIREVFEETGITVTTDSIATVDSQLLVSDAEDFHAIRLIYHANYISGELTFEKNGTTDQCAWFTTAEIDQLKLVNLVKSVKPLLRD